MPEEKTVSLTVIKVLPGGREEIIAEATIDLRYNFGKEFKNGTVDLIPAKRNWGTTCKQFSYTAEIKILDQSHYEVFRKCVEWCRKV